MLGTRKVDFCLLVNKLKVFKNIIRFLFLFIFYNCQSPNLKSFIYTLSFKFFEDLGPFL